MSLRKHLLENKDNLDFLGYHSSKRNIQGYSFMEYNDHDYQRVREVFLNSVASSHEALETGEVEDMINVIEEKGIGVTFISDKPIEGSNFQAEKYKYGNNLYKVYGDESNVVMLPDTHELSATMVIYNKENKLYFEKID